jgi:hypothetical protein
VLELELLELELLELLELLALLELLELLELELATPLELLELELLVPSPLLLEPGLPPAPPVGISRLLRSGSTPYAHAASSAVADKNITLDADNTFKHRVCMSKLSFLLAMIRREHALRRSTNHLITYHGSWRKSLRT